ncbi:MAG: HD-GYP domain-containing protein [Kangiellaceae bacterium]|jgi:putative nucleotidyltransferase with HDIG domain|nr:HD-GYP domain-containing protein [Kangiellaceae bacterium]
MLKRISIDELQQGMYVEAIAEQNGKRRISQRGQISTPQQLQQIKLAGVRELIIDLSKSERIDKQEETLSGPAMPVAEPVKNKPSFQQSAKQAKQLYEQAKTIQNQAFNALLEGKQLPIDSMMSMSDSFVDQIFADQDAMLCASMLRNKDEYLLEHSLNVAILMTTFARYLKFPENEIRALSIGAFLHDIGKIKVDDKILLKEGRLTDSEYQQIKQHVNYGVEAVAELTSLSQMSLDVIAMHHERVDGNGYPNRLADSEISIAGKMASIVDCYDAITANRCYKEGQLSNRAFRILLKESGSHFDEELVQQFIKSLGVYPPGSIVELESGKLAIVLKSNKTLPLKPLVKVFYNLKAKHYIDPKQIDLMEKHCKEEVKSFVRPEDVNLSYEAIFDEFVAS